MAYPPLTNVVKCWSCLMPCERAVCSLFAAQSYPDGYVLIESVSALCVTLSDFDPGKRQQAIERIYNLTIALRIVGGRRVPVYLVDQVWMYDLQQCQSEQECLGFVPFCELLDFINQP